MVKTPWILAAIYAYKYYCQGCFMFLSDQPKLTWVDASYACEQVMLVGSEELNPFQRLNLLFEEQWTKWFKAVYIFYNFRLAVILPSLKTYNKWSFSLALLALRPISRGSGIAVLIFFVSFSDTETGGLD